MTPKQCCELVELYSKPKNLDGMATKSPSYNYQKTVHSKIRPLIPTLLREAMCLKLLVLGGGRKEKDAQ
jgi:hypothetical protein